MLSRRLGGAAGLAFIGLVGSANLILGAAGMPRTGASAVEVREFFATHADAVALSSSIATLVWVALPVFAAGIVARLRHSSEEGIESWPLLGLAAVLMQNTVFAGVVAVQVALATADLSDDSAWALWQVHNALFTLNGTSLALIMLGFSVAGLRGGLIRAWHARLGLTAAVVLALSSFTTPFHAELESLGLLGLVGFVMWLVWVATYAVALLRGRDRSTTATAQLVGAA
jgi:hypothetical protein